ncbi:MAG: glycine cleavage system aminomethyltransferase GcvT [Thiotrichaceae bacterium]|nr:glycine cleavage system aminomethyltransferase GcvT [Thiotrichaceae bacterium]
MNKRTALYEKHIASNAKVIDFGGWDMPLHYGSQLNEHHIVRKNAGVFDVSHMTIVDLSGERVIEFLQYLLANNVSKIVGKKGKALYSCMLNEKGGIIDDLIVYYQAEQQFRMVVNAGTRDKDLAWIEQHAATFAVSVIERTDLAMLAVQGPQAIEKITPLLPDALRETALALKLFTACWDDAMFIARTGYTGEDGFEIILPNEQVADFWDRLLNANIAPIGLGARDTLRLEAGMNLYGSDMGETDTPLESNLAWTIAWKPTERNFIGRDVLEAQKINAEHNVLVGLVLKGKGVLRGHQTVYVDEAGTEGEITSGTYSPTLGISIAFARLPAGVYEEVKVAIRNKQIPAQVVKPPFVRHGKACIDI